MALGYLSILFMVLVVVTLLSITLIYTLKDKKLKDGVFFFLCIWSLLIAVINFTGLPTNYLIQRLIACLIGLLAIVAIGVKIKIPNKANLSYLLASASALLGLLDIFFF